MPLNSSIIVKENPTELARAGADCLILSSKGTIQNKGRFTVAISGGSTPRTMHKLLAQEPYISKLPWNKMSLFWVDERCVPSHDPASNVGVAQKDFLDHVPLLQENIFSISCDMPPEEGSLKYQRILTEFFNLKNREIPVFDLIVLGIGTDGHTASLFPGQESLKEKEMLSIAVKGGEPNIDRITLTLPVLNHAKKVIFLVSGKKKSVMVNNILTGKTKDLPAGMVHPYSGELVWLLDCDAASLLPKELIHGS